MTSIYTDHDTTVLRILNGVTAGLHLVWAIVFITLWGISERDDGSRKDLVYPLYTSFITWTDQSPEVPGTRFHEISPGVTETSVGISYGQCPSARSILFGGTATVAPAWKDSGVKLSLHWLVVSFFLLSAFFQLMMAIRDGIMSAPTIRFTEYSISASVMIVAIALQIGILHTHTLILLATLMWTTMICGLLAEKISTILKKMAHDKHSHKVHDNPHVDARSRSEFRTIMTIAHGIGWVLIAVVFGVLLNAFHQQNSCDKPQSAPKFVWAIVYVELFLFAAFGGVQLLQITDCIDSPHAEMGYIVLSFTSKTILGWLVYGGNFV